MTSALFVGLSTLDIAYAVDRYPGEDTKTQATDQFIGAGGPAANAAVAYAIVTGGHRPTLITALGGHPLADLVRHDLCAHHVEVVDATPGHLAQPPVSSIVVALDAQSRTIVGLDAARIHALFTAELAQHIAHASVVLVDGHHPDLALGITRCANEAGVPVVLDAGRWKPIHDDLLPLVDTVICSSAFAPPDFDGDTNTLLEYLRSVGPKRVAVTRGREPILYATDGQHGAIDIAAVSYADTLGAGDILHGAFCAYYEPGRDFVDALTRASAVATLSCRTFGTRSWAGSLSELR